MFVRMRPVLARPGLANNIGITRSQGAGQLVALHDQGRITHIRM
jgi:hypothetical protein